MNHPLNNESAKGENKASYSVFNCFALYIPDPQEILTPAFYHQEQLKKSTFCSLYIPENGGSEVLNRDLL